jgi:NAD-dependent oxidoreductase involved in siderophore biosynthesis
MSRTSHAIVADEQVWLVDPVDHPEALDRAVALGTPAGVLQLLDRHGRDCAALATRLGVPHLINPDQVPGSPFAALPVLRLPSGGRPRCGGRTSGSSSWRR